MLLILGILSLRSWDSLLRVSDGDLALQIAYDAGRWKGQVDLEEHIDNDGFCAAFIESIQARKTGMPLYEASTVRTVRYNLRSDEWRAGVKKSVAEYMDEACEVVATECRQMNARNCKREEKTTNQLVLFNTKTTKLMIQHT